MMAETLRDYRATTTIDILDRVLDKGIVIDGWWRFYVGGLHLMTVDARVVVASIETYLRHAPVLAHTNPIPWPDILIPPQVPGPPQVPVPPRAPAVPSGKKSRSGRR